MQSTIIAETKMPSAGARSDTMPFLEVRDLEKRFGGVRALKGVSFTIERGRTYHLMGETDAARARLSRSFPAPSRQMAVSLRSTAKRSRG